MSESSREHKENAPKRVRVALVTISTSRYNQKAKGIAFADASADVATHVLTEAGHTITLREVISDDASMIRESVARLTSDARVEAIVNMGGTGIAPSDVTIETVRPMLEKELEGFGEAFRRLSYDQIGTAAILTRSTAGIIGGKAIFCLPGSPNAVETAVKALILPEMGHILAHARR